MENCVKSISIHSIAAHASRQIENGTLLLNCVHKRCAYNLQFIQFQCLKLIRFVHSIKLYGAPNKNSSSISLHKVFVFCCALKMINFQNPV